MKQITIFLLLIGISYSTYGQLYVDGNAKLTVKSGLITLKDRDLQNDGVVEAEGGAFLFRSNENQSLSGSGESSFQDLYLNLLDHNLFLNQDIQINGAVRFQHGDFDLNTHEVTLGANARIEAEREESSFIGENGGTIRMNVPTNSSNLENPANLGLSIYASGSLENTTIIRGHQVQQVGTAESIGRYYEVIPSTNAALNASVQFNYFDKELGNNDKSSLKIWQNKGSDWLETSIFIVSSEPNYMTTSSVNPYGKFTLAPEGATTNALSFCEDFNQYNNGAISPQSQRWTKWNTASRDAAITDAMASDGGKSLEIQYIPSSSEQTDVVLKLGDLTNGTYELNWNMYIPIGKAAYFNTLKFQDDFGAANNFQIFFDLTGIAKLQTGGGEGIFTYPIGQWFNIRLTYNLEEDQVILYLNESGLFQWAASNMVNATGTLAQLGGIDFYAIQNAQFYIDEFCINQINNANRTVEGRNSIPSLPTNENSNFAIKSLNQSDALLGQNQPNPAWERTAIPMTIPMEVQAAHLDIVDLNGRLVKQLLIEERGEFIQDLSLDLAAGIYFYTLLVDGVRVGTKKMVLTR